MRRLREEDGLSLVELLIAATMSLAIFGASLTMLVVFGHQQLGSTQRNDAQDRARLTIDLIARQLRNISSPISSPKLIERAAPDDIVFQTVGTPSGSNVSGAERVRYCIPNDPAPGSSSNEILINQTQTWTTASPPASPWSSDPSVTIACPDTATTTSTIVIPSVTNRYLGRTDRPAFLYDNAAAPTDLTKITSVQLDLFTNPTPRVSAAETELRSGVFLRNQIQAPVANFTPTPTGNGGVLLNGSTSFSPDGLALSYSWSCTTAGCPNTSQLTNAGGGLIDWTPGVGVYTVQLTVSDATGLSSTTTQTVTVT